MPLCRRTMHVGLAWLSIRFYVLANGQLVWFIRKVHLHLLLKSIEVSIFIICFVFFILFSNSPTPCLNLLIFRSPLCVWELAACLECELSWLISLIDVSIMEKLERILSRPVAKPYRSRGVKDDEGPPHLDSNGYLEFAPNDIENPKNWSWARRVYITVVAIILVVNATFASSSPSGCLPSISKELHVSEEASGLVITLFLLGYCAGPLLWAPLSEFYGRRWIFYGTFIAYFAFNFLCAFAPNFAALLVGRFLTGTFASAALSNSPGVLVDIWDPINRGNAMALFSMMTFIGPALGPVTSGFLEITEDWRYVLW